MNKTIGIISYILTILYILYALVNSGFDVLWQSIGGNILYYVEGLPLTEEFSGEGAVVPNILLFIYVLLSGIYFIRIGWEKLKLEKLEGKK